MSKYEDEDGIDGPFDRAMAAAMAEDRRAIRAARGGEPMNHYRVEMHIISLGIDGSRRSGYRTLVFAAPSPEDAYTRALGRCPAPLGGSVRVHDIRPCDERGRLTREVTQ